MAKPKLNEEHVFQACRKVVDRGLPLTARNVRDELGSGSFTTLVPLINCFRTGLTRETSIRITLPPPPQEIENLLKKVATDLWVKFHLNVEPDRKDLEAKHERRVQQLDLELQEAREEIAGHSAEIANLEDSLKSAENELEKMKRQFAEKDGQLQLVKSQLEQREIEIKKLFERAIKAEGNNRPLSKKDTGNKGRLSQMGQLK